MEVGSLIHFTASIVPISCNWKVDDRACVVPNKVCYCNAVLSFLYVPVKVETTAEVNEIVDFIMSSQKNTVKCE